MIALLRRLELVGNSVAVDLKRGVMSNDTTTEAIRATMKTPVSNFHQRRKNRIVVLWS